MSSRIPRAVLELHRFTTTDEHRENLKFVYVEQSGEVNHFTAVATDGHRLGSVDFVLDHGHELPERFGIDASACKEILKGARKDSEFGISVEDKREVKTDGGTSYVECSAEMVSGNKKVSCEAIGTFPDYMQVVPDKEKMGGTPTIGVNPEYIGDVATYLKKCGEKPGLQLNMPSDELSPMLGEFKSTDGWSLKYVVMPIRI
jgi:DNA polymerase III sliding clamp (beta) subunit (PCNA family)